MGTPSIEETERNNQLISDYKSRQFSQVDLTTKYKISAARIYQIIDRDKKRKTLS